MLPRSSCTNKPEAVWSCSEPCIWNATELGLFRLERFLEIPELHGYLTDAADWNADTWDFEPEGCARLARTLGWLYERMPEPFLFSATWGPVNIEDREVDRPGLLEIVESNGVSTGALYKVSAESPRR
jgi:hypothetical protein